MMQPIDIDDIRSRHERDAAGDRTYSALEIHQDREALLAEVARLDAALFFNSIDESCKRVRARNPENVRRAIVDEIEARAIARHLKRIEKPEATNAS